MFGRLFGAVLLLTVLVGICGCGGGGPTTPSADTVPPPPTDEQTKAMLEELGAIIKHVADLKKTPPRRLEEIYQYEPVGPSVIGGLQAKTVVYFWGAGYKSGGNTVVGYGSAVDSKGGWVLLESGTVKQMTADEFKAAPKAK